VPALDLDLSSREDLERWARGFGMDFTRKTPLSQLRAQVIEGLEPITPLSEAGKQKLRIEAVIDRSGAPLGLSIARPPLPEFDGKTTHGLLITNEGNVEELKSGAPDPRYANYEAAGHVEGMAAIRIRELGSSGGVVFHNNTDGTCWYCQSHIGTLLPEGATLLSIPPKGAVAKNLKAQPRPRPHVGNSEPLLENRSLGLSEEKP
jgi:hypothetical protein